MQCAGGRTFRFAFDLIQAHRTTALQNVAQLFAIDAHALCSDFERQALTNDQADRRPIQCSFAAFVVTHVDAFDVRLFREGI